MVIKSLRALEAPITISQLGKIIGMDPGTIKLRISTGKFPTKALLIVGPDTRIDPQALADELERQQGAQEDPIEYWKRRGDEVHGVGQGEIKYRIPVTGDLNDLFDSMSELAEQGDWVKKYDMVAIVDRWANPERQIETIEPPIKIDYVLDPSAPDTPARLTETIGPPRTIHVYAPVTNW
jgi:hypothetical protein